jgi:SAM-dependent methyltransferase
VTDAASDDASQWSLNHDFVLDMAVRLSRSQHARILDFGCGAGLLVARGRQRGLDIVGADTFNPHYEAFLAAVPEAARPHIVKYRDTLPFEDGRFDVVIANMVFEHVGNMPAVLADVARVTKPGGQLLALFPVLETWYEGHAGVYGVHRLRRWPSAQRAFLSAAHRCGLGIDRAGRTSAEWAHWMQSVLQSECHYHPKRLAMQQLAEAFGNAPRSLAADYMAFRVGRSSLQGKISYFPRVVREPVLQIVCHLRAGVVVAFGKSGSTNAA